MIAAPALLLLITGMIASGVAHPHGWDDGNDNGGNDYREIQGTTKETCPQGWYSTEGNTCNMYNCSAAPTEGLCNNLGTCDPTTHTCNCQLTAYPRNGTCESAAGNCTGCENGECQYVADSKSFKCACNAGYNPVGTTCYENKCIKCKNGECKNDDASKTVICSCNAGYKLTNNVCYKDDCVDCSNGSCLGKVETETLSCFCNTGFIVSDKSCYKNDCVICHGGTCHPNQGNKTVTCVCDNGATPFNGLCGLNKSQLAMAIAIPIVGGLVILAIIAGIIAAVCLRKRKREDPMDKEQALAFTAFSGMSSMPSARY